MHGVAVLQLPRSDLVGVGGFEDEALVGGELEVDDFGAEVLVSGAYVCDLEEQLDCGDRVDEERAAHGGQGQEAFLAGDARAADDVVELVLEVVAVGELFEDQVEGDLLHAVLVLEHVHFAHHDQELVALPDVDLRLEQLEVLLERYQELDFFRRHEGLHDVPQLFLVALRPLACWRRLQLFAVEAVHDDRPEDGVWLLLPAHGFEAEFEELHVVALADDCERFFVLVVEAGGDGGEGADGGDVFAVDDLDDLDEAGLAVDDDEGVELGGDDGLDVFGDLLFLDDFVGDEVNGEEFVLVVEEDEQVHRVDELHLFDFGRIDVFHFLGGFEAADDERLVVEEHAVEACVDLQLLDAALGVGDELELERVDLELDHLFVLQDDVRLVGCSVRLDVEDVGEEVSDGELVDLDEFFFVLVDDALVLDAEDDVDGFSFPVRHDVGGHDRVAVEEPDPLAAEVAVVADLPQDQEEVAFVIDQTADEVRCDHPLQDLSVVVDLGQPVVRTG